MGIKYPILAAALLLVAIQCSQDVPIEPKSYGLSVGDPYGSLHIQFFLDLLCPDSKASYGIWLNVRKSLSLEANRVKLTFQFTPLPYHFYASILHQAFFYILAKHGATTAENYLTYVFSKQDDLAEENYLDKTATQFIQEFAARISSQFGADPVALAKDLVIGSDSFKQLKNHYRYTTIVNGVPGAPVFMANGVRVDGAQDFGYQEWINFIKANKA